MKIIKIIFLLLFLSKNINADFLQDIGPGAQLEFDAKIKSDAWHPSGKYFAVGGDTSSFKIYGWNGELFVEKIATDFGGNVSCLQWSKDGSFLAVCGENKGAGIFKIYSWNDFSLTELDSFSYPKSVIADCINWSPNNNYLAVGWGLAGNGVIALYGWNGSNITDLKQEAAFGYAVFSLSWSSNGQDILAGGDHDGVYIYGWDGSVFTEKESYGFANIVNCVDWNSSGDYFAVATSNFVGIYKWYNDEILETGATVDFYTKAEFVSWSPEDKYIAIGGYFRPGGALNRGMLGVYLWDKTGSFSYVAFKERLGTDVLSVLWSRSGKYLLVGGSNPSQDLTVYLWDGTKLIDLGTGCKKDFYAGANSAVFATSCGPDDRFITVAGWQILGQSENCEYDFFVCPLLFDFSFNDLSVLQTFPTSLILGNSALGTDYNLDITVLGGARVFVDGLVWADNAAQQNLG